MAAPSNPAQAAPASQAEQMNRLNMVLANHSANFRALKRSTASKNTPKESHKVTATTKKPKLSFSALKISSASLPINAASSTTSQSQAAANDDDDDFAAEGAGLGFVPAGKEVADDARTAATRDLRGKLLGKRAREQKEEGAAARRRKQRGGGMVEDESDEDEGRSKIGKGRKKVRKAVVVVAAGEEEDA